MKNRWALKCRQAAASFLALVLCCALIAPAALQAQTLSSFQQTSGAQSTSSVGLARPSIRQGQGLPESAEAHRADTSPRASPTAIPSATATSAESAFSSEAQTPALPPNEFQKFVLESTGRALPLFGASFFHPSAARFNPQINTPVTDDYTLGPGDEVLIRGWGAVEIDVRAVIDRNGLINIPRVGAVPLAGVKASDAQGVIRTAIGRYYRDFQLSVTMGQLRGITIYVVGQARRPGAYTLSSLSTLVSALFASGGPNALGSMRHVGVRRGNQMVTELDLYAFLARGDKAADIKLQDGDTIIIPPAYGYIALTGKVNTPAIYELRERGDSIESLLGLAGGLPVVADPKRAYLERVDPSRTPSRSVESFALDAPGLSQTLKNGDLLTVLSLTPEFSNAITLRGNVDRPVRVPWRDGMKVRDLIPSKSYLLSRASVKRQNEALLSAEERERVEQGFDGEVLRPEAGDPQSGDTADTLAQRVGNLVDEVNLEYAVIERADNTDLSVKLLPFNLGKALDDAASPENLALKPGDILTVFSVNDVRVPQAKRHVFVRVEGEVKRPGVYQMKPGDSLRQLVEQAGGLTPDAYLFGASFYREEVRRAQAENLEKIARRLASDVQTRLSSAAASVSSASPENASAAQLRFEAESQAQKQSLDKLRSLRPSGRIMLGLETNAATVEALPALRLENRDHLMVPARPDFVYVLGSVNTESALIWQPGKSVQHYVDLAGMTIGADKEQIFVVRADGSVVSDTDRWFSHVTRSEVMPGDTIVLPEKADHETAWATFTRNAKDITQIVYQFSLGAAAIKTLRE